MASLCGNQVRLAAWRSRHRYVITVLMPNQIQELAEAARLSRTGEGRRIRQQAGVNATAVATACGVTASAVSRWETGTRTPKGKAAVAWVRVIRSLKTDTDETR